jgi:hypothetical protein
VSRGGIRGKAVIAGNNCPPLPRRAYTNHTQGEPS